MVPHHLHEPYTEQCLRAGKHVLLEKPLSHTPESCQRLLREIEAHPHLVTMIGENSQFWPEVAGSLFTFSVGQECQETVASWGMLVSYKPHIFSGGEGRAAH